MKIFKKYILVLVAAVMLMPSCDEGFAELNQNPTAASEVNPSFQFAWIQLRTSGGRYENWRAALIYSSMMIQHFATDCGYWTGDKYTYNGGYSSSLFDRAYTETVKDLVDLRTTLENAENSANELAVLNIWNAVIFHRLTDLYGDVPYSEAGKGFIDGNTTPVYDSQESIYNDMLQKLEASTSTLSSGNAYGGGDRMFAGDLAKWDKFGNSLMLRLGMRLSEVDASAAQSWVSKAIAGGVMSSFDDNAYLQHNGGTDGINRNGIGEVLDKDNGFGDDCPRLSNTLVDMMLITGDPRLDILGVLPEDGRGVHNGMPNGLDATLLIDNPTGQDKTAFDRINLDLARVTSPMMFMTHAETEFLLAEAAVRGWHSGSAEDHYNNGVRSAMKLYGLYNAAFEISDEAIDAYLAANPFDGSLEMIGNQVWMATIFNEYEAYANWRRTGYPVLTPVDYPGNEAGSQVPLRLRYSQGEYGINADNIEAANARQGADQFTTPVWWDK